MKLLKTKLYITITIPQVYKCQICCKILSKQKSIKPSCSNKQQHKHVQLLINLHKEELSQGVTIKDQSQNLQFGVLLWCSGDKYRAKTLNNSYSIFKYTPDPS